MLRERNAALHRADESGAQLLFSLRESIRDHLASRAVCKRDELRALPQTCQIDPAPARLLLPLRSVDRFHEAAPVIIREHVDEWLRDFARAEPAHECLLQDAWHPAVPRLSEKEAEWETQDV